MRVPWKEGQWGSVGQGGRMGAKMVQKQNNQDGAIGHMWEMRKRLD